MKNTVRNLSDLTGSQRASIRLRYGKLEKAMDLAVRRPNPLYPFYDQDVFNAARVLARFAQKLIDAGGAK